MKRKQKEDNEIPAPPYGSQSYWELRYQSHEKLRKRDDTNVGKGSNETMDKIEFSDKKSTVVNDSDSKIESKETTTRNQEGELIIITPAEHAWYFTYEELAPLLIPLILGEEAQTDDDDEEIEEMEYEEDYDNVDDEVEVEDDAVEAVAEEEINHDLNVNDRNEEKDEISLNENKKIYDEKDRKSLLEIGCGDVPLGLDLANEKDLFVVPQSKLSVESETEKNANDMSNILSRIVCCDYSETCIQYLKDKYSTKESDCTTTQVEYIVQDARDLPYKDEEFDIICDKGTLDAMLSDKVEGIGNCVKIVAEVGRVLARNGIFFVVSHLNANAMKGLKWLDDVVVPGLQRVDENADWLIECHASDACVETDDDNKAIENRDVDVDSIDKEDTEVTNVRDRGTDNEDDEIEDDTNYGPAVYVIRKNVCCEKKETNNLSSRKKNNADKKTIPLKFFTY